MSSSADNPLLKHSEEATATRAVFDAVWQSLESSLGRGALLFPKEIFWLNGAPGAGKGTHAATIMEHRRYAGRPIVVSDLLQSPQARQLIDSGKLVGDREVLELLLRKLLEPAFRNGAVVDGFPRTRVQVECLRLLAARMETLRSESAGGFFAPDFHIFVLFVDEKESVNRQLQRGRETEQAAGEVRKTDRDPELARKRHRIFMESTYEPLQTLRDIFQYHQVESYGAIPEVRQRIAAELG
ncbi:MAG: nucleoside monophosphate kinase [Puniceicoccales bacterium]|jgi:adenylate kinase|nr:nucleoside monophosphate kinase [Puniceicoccales bacterium]